MLSIILFLILNQGWNIASRDWWKGIHSDGKYVISSPVRWNGRDWLKCGFILGTTGGIMTQDEGIREWVQDEKTPTTEKISPIIEPFGAEGAIISLGAVYLVGYLKRDTTLKRLSLLCGESVFINTVVVEVIKVIIGRARPYTNKGAQSYSPVNIHGDNQSIPSGHTSTAFAIASCLADESKNPLIATMCYLGATAVGLSRIHDAKHWASDVFLGSVIGISIGKTVAKLNKRRIDEKSNINWHFIPYLRYTG